MVTMSQKEFQRVKVIEEAERKRSLPPAAFERAPGAVAQRYQPDSVRPAWAAVT